MGCSRAAGARTKGKEEAESRGLKEVKSVGLVAKQMRHEEEGTGSDGSQVSDLDSWVCAIPR